MKNIPAFLRFQPVYSYQCSQNDQKKNNKTMTVKEAQQKTKINICMASILSCNTKLNIYKTKIEPAVWVRNTEQN